MFTSHTKKRLALSLVAATVLGSALTAGGSAHADPKQLTAASGVGSDTIQDVMNALSGNSNGINYTPVQSSSASGNRQLISWDAVPPAGVTDACITPKVGGPSFTRPNGSGKGKIALSRAVDGTKWGTPACGGLKDVSGLIDYSRSSSGPTSGDTGTDLTYIPMGRDGVSFAYYRAAGSPVTSLTSAQLNTLYTGVSGTSLNVGGVRIIACGIQTGSGTKSFWQGAIGGVTDTQEATATTECNGLISNTLGGRAEENDGTALKARGDAAAAGTEVIIGFSAAAFTAKSNGLATPTPPATVGMGAIDALGSPVTGSAPNVAPSASYYASATYGRNVYNIFPTAVITSAFGNNDLKSLFVGASSAVCSASTTIQSFGFLPLGANCGTTTTTGSFIVGNS